MLTDAKEKLTSLMDLLRVNAALDLTATIHEEGSDRKASSDRAESSDRKASSDRQTRPARLRVDLRGSDSHLLTKNSGELLNALEHISARVLRLEPEEATSRLHFNVVHRHEEDLPEMHHSAAVASESPQPYAFEA